MEIPVKSKYLKVTALFYKTYPLIKKTFLFSGDISKELPGHLFPTLLCIHSNGRMKMSAISDATGASKPLVTQQVDKLVEFGYLERFYSDDDRRIVEVELTEKGNTLTEKVMTEQMNKAAEKLSRLSDSDLFAFSKNMQSINTILNKLKD
jgi:DNA-binding MarR family transcriptional regulator